jgi:pre-rRNA-processing protein TSR4
MPRAPSETGSDCSDEPSSVLLALPDGAIPPDAADGRQHTTSLIGGYPTFPACAGVPDRINCGSCHEAIPLLAQVYCPLVDGENDRTLYVFACPRAKCRRREGAVRALRASVRNEVYVADVEAKRAEAERVAKEEREKARINPFSAKPTEAGGLFGAGAPLFGAAPSSNPFAATTATPAAAAAEASESAPSAAVAALTIGEPTTLAPPLPAYQPAQYLTTTDEYLPPPESDDEDVDSDDDEDDNTPEAKAAWRGDDGWDKLLPKGVDDVFEKFVRRIQSADDASTQVLRYDFGAVPLPYSSSSALFKKLFPKAPIRKVSSEEDDVDLAEYYNPSFIPKCPRCKGTRVFEAQLVPQLINVLRPSALCTTGAAPTAKAAAAGLSEQQRKAQLALLAKGEADGDEMEWGTIMVFSCARDCVGISEEWVGVEWEASVSLHAAQLMQ